MDPSLILIGKIGAVHGLKGWLKIHSHTESAENILHYRPWFIHRGSVYEELICDDYRWQGKTLVVHLQGLDSREATAHLTNQALYIPRSQLPALKKGEYYWQDLVGLEVRNLQACLLGKITSLLATGANDVLWVEGDKTHCVPYLPEQVIKQVDLVNKRMVVDWPEEL